MGSTVEEHGRLCHAVRTGQRWAACRRHQVHTRWTWRAWDKLTLLRQQGSQQAELLREQGAQQFELLRQQQAWTAISGVTQARRPETLKIDIYQVQGQGGIIPVDVVRRIK